MKLLSITLLVTLLYACEPNPPVGNVMSQERFTKALRGTTQLFKYSKDKFVAYHP